MVKVSVVSSLACWECRLSLWSAFKWISDVIRVPYKRWQCPPPSCIRSRHNAKRLSLKGGKNMEPQKTLDICWLTLTFFWDIFCTVNHSQRSAPATVGVHLRLDEGCLRAPAHKCTLVGHFLGIWKYHRSSSHRDFQYSLYGSHLRVLYFLTYMGSFQRGHSGSFHFENEGTCLRKYYIIEPVIFTPGSLCTSLISH